MELADITAPIARMFRRSKVQPCLHPHLIFDTYKEVILATCCYCGELWVSDEAGAVMVEGRRVAAAVADAPDGLPLRARHPDADKFAFDGLPKVRGLLEDG